MPLKFARNPGEAVALTRSSRPQFHRQASMQERYAEDRCENRTKMRKTMSRDCSTEDYVLPTEHLADMDELALFGAVPETTGSDSDSPVDEPVTVLEVAPAPVLRFRPKRPLRKVRLPLAKLGKNRRRKVSVPCSNFALNTLNPIRKIVDVMAVAPNPEKHLLKLHLGDPTVTGNMPTHPVATEAVVLSLASGKYNGYGPSIGFLETRQAIAEYATGFGYHVEPEDVIVTSGCSHALQMAIESIGNPGQNMLIPNPGFPLYTTLMTPLGVEPRMYNLRMDAGWDADLGHMESLIDDKTAALIVCNPSNPTGAVYSRDHLLDILRIAERHGLPIIADEIYGDMVYDEATFHPMAALTHSVPILTCDGLSKRWLVPGWRLGWLIINDHCDALVDVRTGLQSLSQKIVGPSALIQGAVPHILKNTPREFFEKTKNILSANAKTVVESLSNIPGIRPIKSRGAMYIMVVMDMDCFPTFRSELDLIQALIAEESVYCLPGSCFGINGAIRLVICYPNPEMVVACDRIKAFVTRHFRAPSPVSDKMDTLAVPVPQPRVESVSPTSDDGLFIPSAPTTDDDCGSV